MSCLRWGISKRGIIELPSLFVDNTLPFWNAFHVKCFWFEAVSGLSNNLEKNETIHVSEVPSVED